MLRGALLASLVVFAGVYLVTVRAYESSVRSANEFVEIAGKLLVQSEVGQDAERDG